jgi:hypothetical protein
VGAATAAKVSAATAAAKVSAAATAEMPATTAAVSTAAAATATAGARRYGESCRCQDGGCCCRDQRSFHGTPPNDLYADPSCNNPISKMFSPESLTLRYRAKL